MFNLQENIKKVNLEKLLAKNTDKIDSLKNVFGDKTRFDIYDDYDIFLKVNKIVYDDKRKYPRYEKDHLVQHAFSVLKEIRQKLFLEQIESYCDVGCGWGNFPRAAYEHGAKSSLGIDIKQRPIWEDYARGTDGRVVYKNEDISHKEHGLGKYKLVTSFAAFEHFDTPGAMLKAMSSLVEDDGYLYIKFSPIYNSSDGFHMYRHIHIPWYHLLFSESVCKRFYNENGLEELVNVNYLNKWSAFDFMVLFGNFTDLKLISLSPLWNFNHYWFSKTFPAVLPCLGIEELMISGFEVVFKNIANTM
ncbi:MAG: class I SAM-dependent methyltransferase [Candidatus Accumulibacter sp.]|jgi:hypothetical protein|nr:class I SAM-dependent methyltransferase [Accumulibacter sp.]